MQIQVFAVPMAGDGLAIEELNRFLRSHRVLSITKTSVNDNGRCYWSICVEYLLSRTTGEGGSNKASDPGNGAKPRIDYREMLSKQDFARFTQLRELRRRLADAEAVPVYNILTNAQLAAIATLLPATRSELGAIEGIGEAKLARYGDAFLGLITTIAPRPPTADPETLAMGPAGHPAPPQGSA